jgi:hypothetical protein
MENYLGVKLIKAEPAIQIKGIVYPLSAPIPKTMDGIEGYKVVYPDGYTSFSPKDVFEKAYLTINSDENKITQSDVDNFIAKIDTIQLGEKTTIVKATLKNGFVVVESSSCVDVKNFSMEIGTEICVDKIKEHIWGLLGFLLQCGNSGFNYKGE